MAMTADDFVSMFIKMLESLVQDKAMAHLGVMREIKSIRKQLMRMQDRLTNAERRRLLEPAVDTWVRELKDVMYQADDVVDDCRIKAKVDAHAISTTGSSGGLVRCLYPLLSYFSKHKPANEFTDGLKRIQVRLGNILEEMPKLKLTPSITNGHSGRRTIVSPISPPYIVLDRFEEEARSVVELMWRQEFGNRKVAVIAILGRGGVGKTTLAEKIFNDLEVQTEFSKTQPIWISVLRDISQDELVREMYIELGGKPDSWEENVDEHKAKFCSLVENKKFFLVLDDLSYDQMPKNFVKNYMTKCLVGSRILVTTRDEAVAKRIGAAHRHMVETLSSEDSWSLLRALVFGDKNEQGVDVQRYLRDIGMDIVEKCEGLPLAIKAIAGVLRNTDAIQSEWEKVLSNPFWSMSDIPKGIPGALWVSYDRLPSHLKQSFTYFALFGKNDDLHPSFIQNLWLAEKLPDVENDNTSREHWKELVDRYLLQPNPDHRYMCRMHELVHSLACYLARDESFGGDSKGFNPSTSYISGSTKLRHISINDESGESILADVLKKQVSLRTLMHSLACYLARDESFGGDSKGFNPSTSYISGSTKLRHISINDESGESILADVLKKQVSLRTLMLPDAETFQSVDIKVFTYLRVLDLSGTSIKLLPANSVNVLVHLRYLNLSASEIKFLPKRIGNLTNLQYLLLFDCKELRSLPQSIVSLCNLRNLNIYGTKIRGIPKGIGELLDLDTIRGFILPKARTTEGKDRSDEEEHELCTLEEMKLLSQIRNISIYKLERASGKVQATAAALKEKRHLAILELHCSPCPAKVQPNTFYKEDSITRIQDVFEELSPPLSLENLTIENYFGRKCPKWMVLPNLRMLVLKKLSLCDELPTLGLLPQLDHLHITGASAVTKIGPEFFPVSNSTRSFFPKLKKLLIENMPKWEEWSWLREEDDHVTTLLPCLECLHLTACPKLKSLPEVLQRNATALLELRITGACSLREIKNLSAVGGLILTDVPNLERISDLPVLILLRMVEGTALKEVKNVNMLRYLQLVDSKIESIPEWLVEAGQSLKFKALYMLCVDGGWTLPSRCVIDGPDWHKIRDIPRVEVHAHYGESYISYAKTPFSFRTSLPSSIWTPPFRMVPSSPTDSD